MREREAEELLDMRRKRRMREAAAGCSAHSRLWGDNLKRRRHCGRERKRHQWIEKYTH